jgi:hypothetical protein
LILGASFKLGTASIRGVLSQRSSSDMQPDWSRNPIPSSEKKSSFLMKKFCCGVAVVLVWVSSASAGQVDARFDGKWIGVETFPLTEPRYRWKTPQRTTVIGIAQSGKVLNVLSGFLPGLYPQISPQSRGNTLIFSGGNGVEGRKYCRLKLSADGNTFDEMGSVVVYVRDLDPYHIVTAQVYGTFHRVRK